MRIKSRLCSTVLVFASLILTQTGLAAPAITFNEAVNLYHAGDYEAARSGFDTLSKLGYHHAQYSYGVTYLQGQGVAVDIVRAAAWIGLAAESGESRYVDALAQVRADFDDAQSAAYLQLKEQLLGQFGLAAVLERLAPKPVVEPSSAGPRHADKVRAIKQVQPVYPRLAAQKRVSGQVTVVFAIGADGAVRHPYVIQAMPPGVFEDSALDSLRQWKYEVLRPMEAGELFWAKLTLEFKMAPVDRQKAKLTARSRTRLDQIKGGAQMGNPADQYLYALLASSYPDRLQLDDTQITRLMHSAAANGIANAQYELGNRVFAGEGCEVDRQKGLSWVKMAASTGLPDAQFKLWLKLEDHSEGLAWLEKSARNGYDPAIQNYGWRLATHPDSDQRDGQMAVDLVSQAKYLNQDPELLETLAAAYAEISDFKSAKKYQKKAIHKAGKYKRPVEQMTARMAEYKAGQPHRDRRLLAQSGDT